MTDIDPIATVILIAAVVGIWFMLRGIPRSRGAPLSTDRIEVAIDREDMEYCVYTSAFDMECNGADLAAVLATSGNNIEPSKQAKSIDPSTINDTFDQGYSTARTALVELEMPDLDGYSVMLLLDQSGSMAKRMPRVAGSILATLEWLEGAGALAAMAGFTTVGWQGGRSREQWSKAGRPEYPGRLCDLLHVLYSDFANPTSAADLEPLLEPNVCFENVDGEALLWAQAKLAETRGDKRALIVLSDGAPVDDSTLVENGEGFLWRHLEETVALLETNVTM